MMGNNVPIDKFCSDINYP